MSNRYQFYFSFCALFFLAAFSTLQAAEEKEAILQAAILAQPSSQPTQFQSEKIQPGHSVKLAVVVENVGKAKSPAGTISIHFAFAKPLEKGPKSLLFETESVDLPSIEPGRSVELAFEKSHRWPSISDFIRQDWPLREYQAVGTIAKQQEVIGSLAVTFSAYYYPAVRKELPVKFILTSPSELAPSS